MLFRNKFTHLSWVHHLRTLKTKTRCFPKGSGSLPDFLLRKGSHPPGCYCFAAEEQLQFNLGHSNLQFKSPSEKPNSSQALLTTVLYNFWCFSMSFINAFLPKLVVFFHPLPKNDLGLVFYVRVIPRPISSVLSDQKNLLNLELPLCGRGYYLHFIEEGKKKDAARVFGLNKEREN